MRELTPLEKVTGIDAALRTKLAAFWITSVEELVSTAKSSNNDYGSGRAALAIALGMTEEAIKPIISAANALLPADVSFSVPVEQEFGEGLFLDDYSDLDGSSFAVPVSLPEEVKPLFALPKPQNQGVRNSCVAFTLAAVYQVLSQDATDLSEQFLYWACKDKDGIPGDVGTDPLKAAAVLRDIGVCSEATWAYAPAPSDSKNPGLGPPPPAALAEAQRRRIKSFEKLPATNVPAIKSALAKGKPVLIGLRIWEHWTGAWQGSTLGRIRAPLPGERQRGGHAMCVVGYRDDASVPGRGYFIVRNSWGADWGKENPDGPGFAHVPYKLVSDQGLAAIAFEGVATEAAVPPKTDGGTQAALGKQSTSGKLGGGAVTLADLYAEAQAIQTRLNALVANLGTLLGATPAAPIATTPTPAAPIATDQARPEVTVSAPTAGATMFYLNKLSAAVDPKNEELYPNGLSPEGKPLLKIDATTARELAWGKDKDGGEPKERRAYFAEKIKDTLRRILLRGFINGKCTSPEQLTLEHIEPDDLSAMKALVNDQNLNQDKLTRIVKTVFSWGVVAGIDQGKLEEARWAVVVNTLDDSALIKAIWPLIEHRMRQMGHTPPTVSFTAGEDAGTWLSRHSNGLKQTLKESWGKIPPVLLYRPGERVNTWLGRHNVMAGPVDPRLGVPFYLMLLGRPGPLHPNDQTAIPLVFQHELDIFWGLGRICFTDGSGQHRLNDYTTYAERLVGVEQRSEQEAQSRLRKEIVYFATRHEDDKATIRSADELVRPLTEWSTNLDNLPVKKGFAHTLHIEGAATRATLDGLLRGDADGKAPALLFSASHGLGLPLSDERLVGQQGALVLGDWSGFGNVKREHWFAGEDLVGLSGGPKVEGMLAFLFACYGAGCPAEDEFFFDDPTGRPRIANFPLISQLSQQFLLHGALGVLGHIDRAWTYSFSNDKATAQVQPFADVLGRLMQGRRVGDATDQFDAIQGARAQALVQELEDIKFGKPVESIDLAKLWMARNDARNYIFLGDPAAKLPY